jgi:RHS repeat-associated protein
VRNEGNGYAFAYDVEGKLRIADNGVAFRLIDYDPLGRIRRVGPDGPTLVHAGDQLMAEYAGTTLARRHVFAPGLDEPLVSYAGATRSWLLADERGSVVGETNEAGVATSTFGYGPHGEPDGRGLPQRFGVTGAPVLHPLELTQMRARTYSHNLGRFLQPDPIGQAGGVNLYDYAGGDPVNGWDPWGLLPDYFVGSCTLCNATMSGESGSVVITASWRPSRSRSVIGISAPYGGWSNREWEWEQIYGDGKESPNDDASERDKEGCGLGSRLTFTRSVGGTLFGGFGSLARGTSVSAGFGVSVPTSFFRTGSLAGTQVFASASLTALVSGLGLFGAITTGRGAGYAVGPISTHIPSLQDSGPYAVQTGMAWGAGGEAQLSGPINSITASGTASRAAGYGAYFAGGRQLNVTFASPEFGCR